MLNFRNFCTFVCLLISSHGWEVDGGDHDEKQEGGPLLRHGVKCDWLIRIQFHSVNGAIKDEHYNLLCQQDKRRELSVLAKYFANTSFGRHIIMPCLLF